MSLLVVAYPQLAAADEAWIQTIRQQYDSQYPLVMPHFTLVFPTDLLDETHLTQHVTIATKTIQRFPFLLRCAMIVKDTFSSKTHLFLVPDDGFSALVKLHDRLYTGDLAPALRFDIPFIPHITIGDHVDPSILKQVADQLHNQDIHIAGEIAALDVLRYDQDVVETITTIQL